MNERTTLTSGIVFTLILGTLGHFFYEWSQGNPFIALFSPVNESVWEHTKLLFFPVFLYTLFETVVFLKGTGSFLTSRILGIVLGMFFILTSYFTYTGICGRHFLVLDILIFICSVLITFLSSRYIHIHLPALQLPLLANYVLFLLLIILFFSFTFHPPQLPMFVDPMVFPGNSYFSFK